MLLPKGRLMPCAIWQENSRTRKTRRLKMNSRNNFNIVLIKWGGRAMDQGMIRKKRERLEGRMRRVIRMGIRVAEELLELESLCRNPYHNRKGKCPDCGKISEREGGWKNEKK
jgi:hypothetical protein